MISRVIIIFLQRLFIYMFYIKFLSVPSPIATSTQQRSVLLASQLALSGEEGRNDTCVNLSVEDPNYTKKLLFYVSKHLDKMSLSVDSTPQRLTGR